MENLKGNPEIWGGVECTIVRINDEVHDQLEISGHEKRPEDLQLFADLGIKTIRYPLLWEKYNTDRNSFLQLHDERLSIIKSLNINPVAGLMHHGSGPFYTNLNDPSFPSLLAEYAYTISSRYPWIKFYTPVNEPLTTARFSGLYGIWYPHLNDDLSFLRMFLNQMKAIILSMQAIRTNNPDAGLIQTEDICKIHSTEPLRYQAEFENQRRWLTYDILTGQFNPKHPLWQFFLYAGIKEKELEFFTENHITPEVCGFNYYVSSERFLDHNVTAYPRYYHGGNGRHIYADVEAVRASQTPISLYNLLKEAWERYHLPMALTEIHLNCTREEQMRWFNEAWETGKKLIREEIDFRAITSWSLLGSYDWSSLLIKRGSYECGAYDVRSGVPRPTALSKLIRKLNQGKEAEEKLLEIPGWWRREIRKTFSDKILVIDELPGAEKVPPVLILGGSGNLGKAISKVCHTRGITSKLIDRAECDITSAKAIECMLEKYQPWAVINAAGFTKIDDAEKSPYSCFRVNTIGPALLADLCKQSNIRLVTFSTDQVFNGKKRNPYLETDITEPLNIYGESKRKAEEVVLNVNQNALIIRSSSFFNPWNENDPLAKIINTDPLTDSKFYLPSDIIISPTYVPDMVNSMLDLLIDHENGIWHLSSEEETSYFQFIKMAFDMAGLCDKNLHAVPVEKMNYAAIRPAYSVLCSSQGVSLPPLFEALVNYLSEYQLIRK